MNRIRIAMVAMMAALGLLMLSPSAEAVRVRSHVTIKFTSPDHFYGRVTSGRHFCETFRMVHLNYRPNENAPVQEEGTDRTNRRGRWVFDIEPFATMGDYQAEVDRKVGNPRGEHVVCRPTLTAFVAF